MKTEIAVSRITSTGHSDAMSLLKSLLGPEAGYVNEPDGSPIAVGVALPVNISVSHSRHWVAVAADTRFPIGIDIEEFRTDQLLRVVGRFLNETELPHWFDRLTQAWTCKEAVYKAALTPGLPLKQINLLSPSEALLPDGRRFQLSSSSTSDYCLTLAIPLMS